MPIAYTCPHCGKQFSVAEQFAGQSGPCASCGKTITIPLASAASPFAYTPQPAKGSSAGLIAVVIAVCLLGLPCIIGILVALLLPAVQAARESARRAQSTNNLRQIALALHNYHDVNNSFPPAVVTDADGKPLYSGRVLLLPYMEQQALYDAFDKTQPWDSPQNLAISQTRLAVLEDPSSPVQTPGKTDYLFVTGKGTVFEGDKAVALSDIKDGSSNTAIVVEVRNSGVSWAQPQDLDITQPMSLPPGNHPAGNIVAFADGSVRYVSQAVAPSTVQAMATKDGMENNVILP